MTCDRELLLLISSYADGEATPGEAARAEAHLAHCAGCRKLLEQWQGHQQLFAWAYTRELPDVLNADELLLQARKENDQPMERVLTLTTAHEPKRILTLPRRWAWAGAMAAIMLLAVLFCQIILPHWFLPVGHELVSENNTRAIRMGMNVDLKVGPYAKLRRINERTIRLEAGWVAVNVRYGTGIIVETARLHATDQGTRFHVGIGAKSDYVTVEEGRVNVAAGNTQRTINADQALLASDTGEVTVMSFPPLGPGETDTGLPLRAYNPEFIPSIALDIARIDGLKRLATRFPDAQIEGMSWGEMNLGNDQESALWITPAGGLREAMRANFVQITRLAAGGKADAGEWDIPVTFMQVIGYQPQMGLADDIYFVRLTCKDGNLTWQFNGSQGQQVDLPVTFAAKHEGAMMEGSFPMVQNGTSFFPNDIRTVRVLQLVDWPAAAKPMLELRLNGRQQLTRWDGERALITEIERQFQNVPEIKLSALTSNDILYLDPQQRYRMVFAGNVNCGAQMCRAYAAAQEGHAGSVMLGVLFSDMPLTTPPAAKGTYLVRFVLPGAAQAPHLELTTVDNRPIANWGGASTLLKSGGLPDEEIKNRIDHTTNTPPAAGNLRLSLGVTAAHNNAFAFQIQVSGRPDDAATREIKQGNETSRRTPDKEWAAGWVSIQQP